MIDSDDHDGHDDPDDPDDSDDYDDPDDTNDSGTTLSFLSSLGFLLLKRTSRVCLSIQCSFLHVSFSPSASMERLSVELVGKLR